MALEKVLLADDSRIFRALMIEVLRDHGLEVVEAVNGSEALDLMLGQRPQLAILDGLMPVLSGFEVVTRLREQAPDYQPVVFIVTAVYRSRRFESEARLQYKVDEYLEKPLEPEDLLNAIRRHFPDFAAHPRTL